MTWRRSYDVPPPPLPDDDPLSQASDPRYALLPPSCCRGPSACATWSSGCCRTGTTRSSLTWRPGRTALVVAHGNSLRALVKHLDGISDADIAELNIPTGMPLIYELDDQFRPVSPGGRYLDPGARGGRRPKRCAVRAADGFAGTN